MTNREALALALFGHTRRRLLAAAVRTLLGRPLPDVDLLAPRAPGEPAVTWTCRCAGHDNPSATARTLLDRADRLLAEAARHSQQAIGLDDPDYPAPLPPDSRSAAAALGAGPASRAVGAAMIAVVGARAATRGGLAMAAELAAGLAAAGITVVSGLARGVDGAAHRGARSRRAGRSSAVLGSGLDRLYPVEHAALAAAMAPTGAVVSEHLPGTPPLPHHFPATQPHHQRPGAGGGGRRGVREERLAHHRPAARSSRGAR